MTLEQFNSLKDGDLVRTGKNGILRRVRIQRYTNGSFRVNAENTSGKGSSLGIYTELQRPDMFSHYSKWELL